MASDKKDINRPQKSFSIVGIGASAGGLEAFAQLLAGLETDTGMAFVLVQHLDPNHESLLTEILAKSTKMPVLEVVDGMIVQPNHIYVLPPKARITLAAGTLKLASRAEGGSHLPIDEFFTSLANEQRERAIGVILSGTGSDGKKGIEAISAQGGVTFAQEKTSAKFDGMPDAAIESGVDHILTPQDIAKELAIIAKPAFARTDRLESSEDASSAFVQILEMLFRARGIDFTHYKTPTMERRVMRRMARNNFDKVGDYAKFLRGNPDEIDLLYEDILIKVTSFFRDAPCFDLLKTHVFPAIMLRKSALATVRIWVPGCATGEEAYSIVICLLEYLKKNNRTAKIEMFATDISESAFAKARNGEFGEEIANHVSPDQLNRYFVKTEAGYRVISTVRECCIFAKQNVAQDPPFSKMDLISCRNLLIYLSPVLQKKVLSTFHFALRNNGFLLLGSAETIGSSGDLFDSISKDSKVFSKNSSRPEAYVADFPIESFRDTKPAVVISNNGRTEVTAKSDLKADADRAIQNKIVPPGVVVNDRMEVIQFRGDTSPYLTHPPGDLTASLFKMCREGLLSDLRAGFHDVTLGEESIKRDSWVKNSGKTMMPVTIDLIPFGPHEQRHFAILFSPRIVAGTKSSEPSVDDGAEIFHLQRELVETKEYLNALIEKEQATNEELKSASEEILSANEELQSSNEEMATAKEETQAANEELTTVNEELQSRSQDLTRVSSDLTNLFSSVQIPIVMISEKLAIRLITPSAEKALNLMQADIGKTLSEMSSRLTVVGLDILASQVLETLNTKDQEIQDRSGRWYSLRIKPYRTIDNKIQGAVIALLDIDALKRSKDLLESERDYANAIVQTTPSPLLVLDGELKVVTANPAFCKHFHIQPGTTNGLKVYDLGGGQWNTRPLRKLLEELLPKDGRIENFIVTNEFPRIGRRILRLNANRLIQINGTAAKILLAIDDITEEKRTVERVLGAKEFAEAASQAKTDFLANMSHEIRTPIAAIMGYAELIADPEQPKKQVIQSAGRILKRGERLTELVDEILDISKVEAGKLEVERIRIELLPELGDIFSALKERAEGKGLLFDVALESDIPQFVTTCPKRLGQILTNIVGNAIKFTDEGGISIAIKLEAEDSPMLDITVGDTGCGMNPAQQDRLFQAFSQADSSITRKYGGTGLGLLLAKRLAQALGGDVVLSSSGVKRGSVFTIRIDVGKLDNVKMLSDLKGLNLERHMEYKTDWLGANLKLAGMRILLAEDDPDNQAIMSEFLKSSAALVDVANDGDEAVAMAQTEKYDLVLMDIHMPGLDGYGAARQLRLAGSSVPIVALTAQAMVGEKEKCLAAGCMGYISKPVKANVLIETASKYKTKKSV